MKATKIYFGRLLFGTTLLLLTSLFGCGEEPGLYQEEELTFENGKEGSSGQKKLNLGADESSDFGFWPASFFPFPAPVFPYYLEPVPVAIPISPYQAITEWVHPMYAFGMAPFWPNCFGPC